MLPQSQTQYLFCLPPSPVFLSHSAFVKHLFYSVTILEHFCFIYLFFNLELGFIRGARETSSVFAEKLYVF